MFNFFFFLLPDIGEATPVGPSDMTGFHIIHALPLGPFHLSIFVSSDTKHLSIH